MLKHCWVASVLLAVGLSGPAMAQDAKYPDLKGQWRRATSERGGLLAGGADVGEFFAFQDVDVHVVVTGVFADAHALIRRPR